MTGGPLFVVREFDARIVRSRNIEQLHTLSEQAKRAGVRSVILHMNLKLEHGTKDEIQLLKQVGVLGRRAPSCSMLCGNDMALMLDAFGKKAVANELRAALSRPDSIRKFDASKVVRDEDIEAEERRIAELVIQQQSKHGSTGELSPVPQKLKANPLTGKMGRARLAALLKTGQLPELPYEVDDGSYIPSSSDGSNTANRFAYIDIDSNKLMTSYNTTSNDVYISSKSNPIFDAIQTAQNELDQQNQHKTNNTYDNNNSNTTGNNTINSPVSHTESSAKSVSSMDSTGNSASELIHKQSLVKRLKSAEATRNQKIMKSQIYDTRHIHHTINDNNNTTGITSHSNSIDLDSLAALAATTLSAAPIDSKQAAKFNANIGHTNNNQYMTNISTIPTYVDSIDGYSHIDDKLQLYDAGGVLCNIPIPGYNQSLLLPLPVNVQ